MCVWSIFCEQQNLFFQIFWSYFSMFSYGEENQEWTEVSRNIFKFHSDLRIPRGIMWDCLFFLFKIITENVNNNNGGTPTLQKTPNTKGLCFLCFCITPGCYTWHSDLVWVLGLREVVRSKKGKQKQNFKVLNNRKRRNYNMEGYFRGAGP